MAPVGSPPAEPGINIKSWFRQLHGADTLSGLFPKFWSLFESDKEQRDTILRAVDWYLQSNMSPPHVGIILTVAALERLSFQVLGRERDSNESNGGFIKKALEKLQVPLDFPKSYEALQKVKNWDHGPHAVVAIRNNLVQRNPTLAGVSNYATHEAWNLGQWYIEMMLLGMLEYGGFYKNRLVGWREHDRAFLPVPWVREP